MTIILLCMISYFRLCISFHHGVIYSLLANLHFSSATLYNMYNVHVHVNVAFTMQRECTTYDISMQCYDTHGKSSVRCEYLIPA